MGGGGVSTWWGAACVCVVGVGDFGWLGVEGWWVGGLGKSSVDLGGDGLPHSRVGLHAAVMLLV